MFLVFSVFSSTVPLVSLSNYFATIVYHSTIIGHRSK